MGFEKGKNVFLVVAKISEQNITMAVNSPEKYYLCGVRILECSLQQGRNKDFNKFFSIMIA